MTMTPSHPVLVEHDYDLIVLERRVKAAGNLHGRDALALIEALSDAWNDIKRLEEEVEGGCPTCLAAERAGHCDACGEECPDCHGHPDETEELKQEIAALEEERDDLLQQLPRNSR